MICQSETSSDSLLNEVLLATFQIGDLLLGIEIEKVQEINRHLDTTDVPYAPECVRGVVNLRGDVVTVLSMRSILKMEPVAVTNESRNLIVSYQGELIGLMVDGISDILTIKRNEIDPAPANLSGVDGRYFRGVHTMEDQILIWFELDKAIEESAELNACDASL